MLIKSGRSHFNIFEQQDAGEILACILDELCGDCLGLGTSQDGGYYRLFVLPPKYWQWRFFYHLSASGSKHSAVVFLNIFLTPEHLSGDNSFFCNYFLSLKTAIIEHGFSRVRQFLIVQLKWFVNFQGTVTKDINLFQCFTNISIPAILENDIVE